MLTWDHIYINVLPNISIESQYYSVTPYKSIFHSEIKSLYIYWLHPQQNHQKKKTTNNFTSVTNNCTSVLQ